MTTSSYVNCTHAAHIQLILWPGVWGRGTEEADQSEQNSLSFTDLQHVRAYMEFQLVEFSEGFLLRDITEIFTNKK